MSIERKTAPPPPAKAVQKAVEGFKSLQSFITKFNNDWVFSMASGLAFNLIVATIPLLIATIALVGVVYGSMSSPVQQELITRIQQAFPPPIPSQEVVGLALQSLARLSA